MCNKCEKSANSAKYFPTFSVFSGACSGLKVCKQTGSLGQASENSSKSGISAHIQSQSHPLSPPCIQSHCSVSARSRSSSSSLGLFSSSAASTMRGMIGKLKSLLQDLIGCWVYTAKGPDLNSAYQGKDSFGVGKPGRESWSLWSKASMRGVPFAVHSTSERGARGPELE